ncbi:MAG: glycosyltransferase [Alphaproteobacteria bacterium]
MNIISLTTIPPRMDRIGDTLASLLAQSLKPDRVILNIPKTYRREAYRYDALPVVPAGVEVLVSDVDYGPATKLLPTLRAFAGQEVNIVFCDDDRLYPRDWLSTLVENAKRHPHDCITVSGGLISQIEAYYRYINRPQPSFLAPLYRRFYALRKRRPVTGGRADIVGGFGGVLVRPSFFDDAIFTIREEFITLDDTWISGHLARSGVAIRIAEGAEIPAARDVADVSSLKDFKRGAMNQNAIDVACIQYFRETYGIWKPGETA